VLAAAVLVVPIVTLADSDPVPQHNTPAPGVVAGQFSCPPPSGNVEPGAPLEGPDRLPPAPIAARLCFNGGLPWQAPQDALLAGLGEIVSSINDLHKQRDYPTCDLNWGPTWAILFQYPDGYTQLVRGRAYGCGGISIGSMTRGTGVSSDRVLFRFQELLWEQRATAEPGPVDTTPPACSAGGPDGEPGVTWLPQPPAVDLVSGRLCWWVDTDISLPENSAPLAPEDLAVIVKDMQANTVPVNPLDPGPCDERRGIRLALTVATSWGDGLRFDGECGEVFDLSGDWTSFWRPGPESRAIIDRIVASKPSNLPTVDAGTAPEDVISAWAYLFNFHATARSSQLWVDRAQPEGDTVDVKVIGTAPFEPGDTDAASYDEAVQVRAEYRLLPADAELGFHEVGFVLVRNDRQPWRILGITEGTD